MSSADDLRNNRPTRLVDDSEHVSRDLGKLIEAEQPEMTAVATRHGRHSPRARMKQSLSSTVCAAALCLSCVSTAQAAVMSFSGGSIAIPATGTSGIADPYPSTVNVSGVTGTVTSLDIALLGLTHTFPDDIDILLVAPGGQTLLLMSDAGGIDDISAIDLVFRDGAPSLPGSSQIVSGTYAPTNVGGGDAFDGPAPAGPYGTTIAGLLAGDPNGTWQMFVNDDVPVDVGALRNWRLDFTVDRSDVTVDQSVPEPGTLALLGLGLAGLAGSRRRKQFQLVSRFDGL